MRGLLGSWSPANKRYSRRLWARVQSSDEQDARVLASDACQAPVASSSYAGLTLAVGLDKHLTRVQVFPDLDRGEAVPASPIMRQWGGLSLLASPAASVQGQRIGPVHLWVGHGRYHTVLTGPRSRRRLL